MSQQAAKNSSSLGLFTEVLTMMATKQRFDQSKDLIRGRPELFEFTSHTPENMLLANQLSPNPTH